MNAASPRLVAQFMIEELSRSGILYQEIIVYEIQTRFGDEFVYINQNGNLAISRPVLDEFKKLTVGKIVWERGDRCWRPRMDFEDPSKRQAD